MRTSEVAGQVGVNVQTLRYYERRGLLEEPPRSPSGYRDYPADTVRVLRFVKRAQELGFSLAGVAELLHLASGGPDNCDEAKAVAETHLTGLEQRIAELQRMRSSLTQLVATCGRPRADRACPLLEAIDHPNQTVPAQQEATRQ